MIRPSAFSFNHETAKSNRFQNTSSQKTIHPLALSEFDRVVELLDNYGIQVQVFEDTLKAPDALFPNNWISHMPDQQITTFPMQATNRRIEVRPDIVEWLKSKSEPAEIIDLSTAAESDQFLEGTGSIVFDYTNKVAFACTSPRTSVKLFESYCHQIGFEAVSFESLDLYGHPIYHTNVMMAIADQYAIINLESIEHPVERIMIRKKIEQLGKELIEINHDQMNKFCGNVMQLQNREGESFLVMSQRAYNAFDSDQLRQIQAFDSLISVDVSTIEEFGGGGVRCMLAGLFMRAQSNPPNTKPVPF